MAQKTVVVPITNVYAEGDYTGTIYVGSQKKPANVLLDTGSSTLAIEESAYNPAGDPEAQVTDLLQEVSYEDKSGWVGAVVRTDITVGEGTGAVVLPKVNTAVAFKETSSMFGKYNGILGLAYSRLNDAYQMPGNTFPPTHSFNQVQESRKRISIRILHSLKMQGSWRISSPCTRCAPRLAWHRPIRQMIL